MCANRRDIKKNHQNTTLVVSVFNTGYQIIRKKLAVKITFRRKLLSIQARIDRIFN